MVISGGQEYMSKINLISHIDNVVHFSYFLLTLSHFFCRIHLMRDDIFKSAPLSKRWRYVMRRVANPAYSASEIAIEAERALARDWQEQISPAFIRNIRKRVDNPQGHLSGVPAISEEESVEVLGGKGSETERRLLEYLKMNSLNGTLRKDILIHSLNLLVTDSMERQINAICGHLMKESGDKQAREVCNRIGSMRRLAPISVVAKLAAEGNLAHLIRRQNSSLDISVDLR